MVTLGSVNVEYHHELGYIISISHRDLSFVVGKHSQLKSKFIINPYVLYGF